METNPISTRSLTFRLAERCDHPSRLEMLTSHDHSSGPSLLQTCAWCSAETRPSRKGPSPPSESSEPEIKGPAPKWSDHERGGGAMAASHGRVRLPVAVGDVCGAVWRSPGSPEKEREGLPGREKSLEHKQQPLRDGRLPAVTDRRFWRPLPGAGAT